eukprot:GGOE01061537.1.p1 GENE.GGOE01061537.1~~GGOE01061537.1.p1  ORF type:complete len:292 (+),score=76.86 GGOE01061537.1:86-877(+)
MAAALTWMRSPEEGALDWAMEDTPPCKRARFSMEPLHTAVEQISIPNEVCDVCRIQALFDRYAQLSGVLAQGEKCITGDGLTLLERDFGWPADNHCTYFALRYCLSAQHMNLITLPEWMQGFARLRCDTVDKAKRKLIHYQVSLKADRHAFQSFFNYVFRCLNRQSLRCIDTAVAQRALLAVVGNHSPFTLTFCQFLTESAPRGMNADQWRNFLPFSFHIRPDFSNYDLNDAWPSIYDDYVEWLRRRRISLPTPADPSSPSSP